MTRPRSSRAPLYSMKKHRSNKAEAWSSPTGRSRGIGGVKQPDGIPFCDLTRGLSPIRNDIDRAIGHVVDSGSFLRGAQVEAFERAWAEYCGQEHCVTCGSGTDALTLAALALELAEVDLQANTLALSAMGLERGGACVRVREVDESGRLPTVSTRAVPVLLYGRAASAEELNAILFDAAQAHGWRPPRHAVACWSFYPTKTLGALGDGGAVTTNDARLARALRTLCRGDDRLHDSRQINSRMAEVQAAVLRVKLDHLDTWLADRRRIAESYNKLLPPEVVGVATSPKDLHHLFVVRARNRDSLAHYLEDCRIGTKVHFPEPLHRLQDAWNAPAIERPQAEAWCNSILSLPCYPGLRDGEIETICAAISDWLSGVKRTSATQ
jgi:dTDP-4-amino-4,6-dideoxygalactose transaminase